MVPESYEALLALVGAQEHPRLHALYLTLPGRCQIASLSSLTRLRGLERLHLPGKLLSTALPSLASYCTAATGAATVDHGVVPLAVAQAAVVELPRAERIARSQRQETSAQLEMRAGKKRHHTAADADRQAHERVVELAQQLEQARAALVQAEMRQQSAADAVRELQTRLHEFTAQLEHEQEESPAAAELQLRWSEWTSRAAVRTRSARAGAGFQARQRGNSRSRSAWRGCNARPRRHPAPRTRSGGTTRPAMACLWPVEGT